MKIAKAMTKDEQAAVGAKVIQMIVDTANMPLKEKEQWLLHIPKDYKADNDMTIVKFRIWNEIRNELVKSGHLVASDEQATGQQSIVL